MSPGLGLTVSKVFRVMLAQRMQRSDMIEPGEVSIDASLPD